jgi:hypothetical protein
MPAFTLIFFFRNLLSVSIYDHQSWIHPRLAQSFKKKEERGSYLSLTFCVGGRWVEANVKE